MTGGSKVVCSGCSQERYDYQINANDGVCVYCVDAKSRARQAETEALALSSRQKSGKILSQRAKIAARQKTIQAKRAELEALEKAKNGDPLPEDDQAALEAEFDAQKEAERELAARILSKKHLLPFTMRFNKKYEPGWVHKDICQRLEKFSKEVAEKKSPRLMLFMPPRHGKSELASRNYPAWHLGHYPDHEIISCSYSASLAMKFGKKARSIVRDPLFKNVFKTRIDEDNAGAEGWMTTEGGGYMPAGVGGPITGNGAHVLIIDDPVKNREEAESETVRSSNKDWYSSTALTRLAPGGGVLVILTRWHEDDLAGWLLSEQDKGGEQWEVIRYPAIAEEDEPYRKKGEALHPARYDVEALARRKRALIPRDWDALYQQRPVSDDGDYFQKPMFQNYDRGVLEAQIRLGHKRVNYYAAWDLAIGQNTNNDYTVGVIAAVDQDDNIYIVDVVRGHYDGLEICDRVIDAHVTHDLKITGIEKGHIEMALGPLLNKRVTERRAYSFYHEPLKTGRADKEARARTIQGRMRQGKVFFPFDAPFFEPLYSEMLKFPVGKHDDQVDAMAWLGLLLEEFHAPPTAKTPRQKSWRDKIKRTHGSTRSAGGAMSA